MTVPIFAVGLGFGVLAGSLGWGVLAPTVMSALVFSGSAQLAATSVVAGGGSLAAAVAAGVLVNARFVPMGIAVAGSLKGPAWRRALEGQAVVDAGWAIAHRGGGRFDRQVLIGFFLAMVPAWIGGTLLGTLLGARVSVRSLDAWGLDVVFPAFFLALLAEEIKDRRAASAAALAAGTALALLPVLPAGLPVVCASAAALLGLVTDRSTRRARRDQEERG